MFVRLEFVHDPRGASLLIVASPIMRFREISGALVDAYKRAGKQLKGLARRAFQAQATKEFCDGSSRLGETVFGWNRNAIQRGLTEIATGKPYSPVQERRGRPRCEARCPEIFETTKQIIDDRSQTDPTFHSTKIYTRVTGQLLREALAESLGIPVSSLPSSRTMRRVLNRTGYSLKKIRKTLPLKKIPQTDSIFANVQEAHRRASQDTTILRISIDTKAKVKIGPFSRGGMTRCHQDQKAADHDMGSDALLVPVGILEIESHQLSIGFGQNTTTSDLIVDTLEQWWTHRQASYPHIKTIMIDLDNGPEVSGRRTQFLKRMVDFADKNNLKIELVYYPPYHSKYNRIERCWGSLEQHWNGTILRTTEIALQWAATMTWHGIRPIVWTLDKIYSRGVKWTKKAFKAIAARLQRTIGLETWSVKIEPAPSG